MIKFFIHQRIINTTEIACKCSPSVRHLPRVRYPEGKGKGHEAAIHFLRVLMDVRRTPLQTHIPRGTAWHRGARPARGRAPSGCR